MTVKKITAATLAAMAVATGIVMAEPVEHHTVLTGKVASVLPVGTSVKEGETLVTVETLAGPMAAAKSIVNGTVTAVSVQAGQDVKRGQVVITVDGK